jgi:hypothetical protein
MGRRPYEDRGKEVRRYRLALYPDQWLLVELHAPRGWHGPNAAHQIEWIVAQWAQNWPTSAGKIAIANGPALPADMAGEVSQ